MSLDDDELNDDVKLCRLLGLVVFEQQRASYLRRDVQQQLQWEVCM